MTFRYYLDPVHLTCLGVYWIHRLVIRRHCEYAILNSYLNDLLVVPVVLPPMLWVMRELTLRRHDEPPSFSEIMIPIFVWSVLFEILLPRIPMDPQRFFADPVDVLAYLLGGILAGLKWGTWRPVVNEKSSSPGMSA